MNYHRYFGAPGAPVETCLVGSGSFGRSFLAQGRKVPRMRARVAVDVDAETAAVALRAAGFDPREIAVCQTAREAKAAWDAGRCRRRSRSGGRYRAARRCRRGGNRPPEAGARHARMAVEAGRHLVLVSKDVDSVVGPGLARQASARGRIVTPVDGDQPSLLIGLVTWAETLGLAIVAAGKSSEYDFVFDAATESCLQQRHRPPVPGFAAQWTMEDGRVADIVTARARSQRPSRSARCPTCARCSSWPTRPASPTTAPISMCPCAHRGGADHLLPPRRMAGCSPAIGGSTSSIACARPMRSASPAASSSSCAASTPRPGRCCARRGISSPATAPPPCSGCRAISWASRRPPACSRLPCSAAPAAATIRGQSRPCGPCGRRHSRRDDPDGCRSPPQHQGRVGRAGAGRGAGGERAGPLLPRRQPPPRAVGGERRDDPVRGRRARRRLTRCSPCGGSRMRCFSRYRNDLALSPGGSPRSSQTSRWSPPVHRAAGSGRCAE